MLAIGKRAMQLSTRNWQQSQILQHLKPSDRIILAEKTRLSDSAAHAFDMATSRFSHKWVKVVMVRSTWHRSETLGRSAR